MRVHKGFAKKFLSACCGGRPKQAGDYCGYSTEVVSESKYLPRGSALFVPGNKANKTFAVLSPYLDFDTRFGDLQKLQKELALRGSEINASDIKQSWEFYKTMSEDKVTLQKKIEEIQRTIEEIKARKDKGEVSTEEEEELVKLLTQVKVIKQDLKIIKETLWDLEESVVPSALSLPNELDVRTPPGDKSIVAESFGEIVALPEDRVKNHLDIGQQLGLLEYRSPVQCYLCNDAAVFELGVLSYFGRKLSEHDMIRVAGSDFTKSIVVEGSGLSHENPLDSFILDENKEADRQLPNRLHLVGGASLVSFLALHAKQIISSQYFPLKYFASGRQYTPCSEGSSRRGLFTLCQSSAVQIFIAVNSSAEADKELDIIVDKVCLMYKAIASHFRTVTRPANELKPWECVRVSFEMWSPFAKQYVEVGHVSACGDYFSKRLLIACQSENGKNNFPMVITGTVLSVPRVLGCLLEENPDKFVLPKSVVQHSTFMATSQ